MIYTVSLNPSLDRTLCVPRLRLGELNRAQVLRQDLAGKGMNVSRALQALGIDSAIVGFVGGAVGRKLRQGLIEAGFAVYLIEVIEESRQNITLLDRSTGEYTKINEPGAGVNAGHLEAMRALVGDLTRPGDIWTFCGSLPPGAPADIYAQLIRLVRARGGKAFLDSSGAALEAGLAARPFGLKPNDEEASALLGMPLAAEPACRKAVALLRARGVKLAALTRGARGLVLGMNGRTVVAHPPPVDARSPIGAGDATLAGLVWAVADGCGAIEAARRAVACGAAAAMQEGTAVGDRALVESLLPRVLIDPSSVC